MLSSIKTTFLLVVATTLFGFTEYGSQTISQMRGTATSTADQGIDDLASKAHQYVKAIAPPESGHGYSPLSTVLTFAAFFVIVALYREVLNRLIIRRWPMEDPKNVRWLSWNFVSMTFCIIVSAFGLLQVKNVIKMFMTEFWDAYNDCGTFGMFFTSCSTYSFLATSQLIRGLDYINHSSNVMMITLLMAAYFVYDLSMNKPNRDYIYHHILCLACIGIYAWTQSYAFYVAAGCVTELSTIFLAASSLFSKKSNWRAISMIDFCFTFFVSRVLFLQIIIAMIWLTESGSRFVTAMSSFIPLNILNLYWFVMITRKVIRVCRSTWGKNKTDEQ